MTTRKIQLKDQIGRVIRINPSATVGAVVGVDLRWPDGTLVTPNQLSRTPAAPQQAAGTISQTPTAWSAVQGKPQVFPSQWGMIGGTLSLQLDLQAELDGKEPVFAKGNLIAGANAALTGVLAGRLVGAGDVTVAAIGAIVISQPTAQLTWTLNHNLGRFASADVYTVGGLRVWSDVQNISVNQLLVTLTIPMSGFAVIN